MKRILLLIAMAMVVPACGDDGGKSDTEPMVEDGPPVGVRLLHVHDAVPAGIDMVLRDIESSDEIRIDAVGHRKASDWVAVPPGIYRLLFFRNGSTDVLPELAVEAFDVQEGIAKTVILGQSETGDARTIQLVDDIGAVPAENHAQLRFVHMAQSGPIDMYDDDNGSRIVTNIGNSQFQPYAEFPATRYNLTLYEEGLKTNTVATATELPLPPATVSTVVLVGDADPNGDGDTVDSTAELVLLPEYSF
jgi:hypothetical protein